MSSPARKALDFFKGILYNKVRSCVPKNKEAYRSGHNGPDSKSKPFFVSLFSESLDITGFFGVSQFHILLVLPIRSPRFPR